MSENLSHRPSCPRCHSLESPDALLCRVCYEPLSKEPLPPLPLANGGNALHFRRSLRSPDHWIAGFAVAAIASLVSSGWWKGKARYAALGSAVGLGLVGVLVGKWLTRRTTRSQDDPRAPSSPVRQIPPAILRYALESDATQVRLTLRDQGVPVEHLVNGVWRTQLTLPRFLWAPLKNELTVSAGRGHLQYEQQGMKAEVALNIIVEPPHQEIQLTVL